MNRANVEESIMSCLSQIESDSIPNDLNIVAMLHNFWEQKQKSPSSDSYSESDGSVGVVHAESLLLYESAPSPGPPYVCYVTLPGGSCFGNYKVCETQAEARRDAARVALMNSLVNELPCRRIDPQFIAQSLQQATADSAVSVSLEDACDSSTSIGTYSFLLHSYIGRTMLEFQEMMTVFQLLHWNGTLKALRKKKYSRKSVIAYYSQRGLDECMRSSMALDWLVREQRSPGQIGEELRVAQRELVLARRQGVELRYRKEKTEILSLALSQAYVHAPEAVSCEMQSHARSHKHAQLPLHTFRKTEVRTTPPCTPSPTLRKNTTQTDFETSGKHTASNNPSPCSQHTYGHED